MRSQAGLDAEPVAPLSAALVVRRKRTKAGLSARALSMAAGLGEAYVSKLESGETEPSLAAFSKLAVCLRLSPLETFVVVVNEAHR